MQTNEEFEKQAMARLGKRFPATWKDALAYVNGFDKSAPSPQTVSSVRCTGQSETGGLTTDLPQQIRRNAAA